jgi:hypothetical protein
MRLGLVLIFFFWLLSYGAYAQGGDNLWDVIYLKNGGIVKGVIIEQIPGKTVKIQQRDGNVLIFNYEDIDKILKESKTPAPNNEEAVTSSKKSAAQPQDSTYRFKRFFAAPFIAFNSLWATNAKVDNQLGYDFGFLAGYRFHNHWSVLSGLVVTNSIEKFQRGQYRFELKPPPPIDSTYILILDKYEVKKTYTFLNFPLVFRYHSEKKDSKVGFYLDLGMRFGFIFYKEKEYHQNLIIRDNQNVGFNWDFITLGFGLKVPIIKDMSLYAGPNYSLGMARINTSFEIVQNLGGKIGVIYLF